MFKSAKACTFLVFVCMAAIPVPVCAQDNKTITARVLDSDTLECFSSRFFPTTASKTKGAESLRSSKNTLDENSFQSVDCFTLEEDGMGGFAAQDYTITFDWRYEQDLPYFPAGDEVFRLTGRDDFGRRFVLAELTSGSPWTTRTIYVPRAVTSISWTLYDDGLESRAWLDNLRVQKGNHIGNRKSRSGEFSDNPLSVAVDNTGYFFDTLGENDFFVEREIVRVGKSAVQSGDIDDDQQNYFVAFAEAGKTISFDWKTSSEAGFDGLVFYQIDEAGAIVGDFYSLSGETDWVRIETKVAGKGETLLVWAYLKDVIISSGQDTGWIDNIQIGPSPAAALSGILPLLIEEDDSED